MRVLVVVVHLGGLLVGPDVRPQFAKRDGAASCFGDPTRKLGAGLPAVPRRGELPQVVAACAAGGSEGGLAVLVLDIGGQEHAHI